MFASPRVGLLAANALLALGAGAQVDAGGVPAALWAAFPADELPRLLHDLTRLGSPERTLAIPALSAMGPRAHRWLAGALRLRGESGLGDGAEAVLAPAPTPGWALPLLLERIAAHPSDFATRRLLERLGSAAKPAVPLLLALRLDGAAKGLAAQLAASPDRATAVEALPGVRPVDPAFREPLLAVLRDPAQRARWWPALQALLGIDAAAAQAAAEILVLHCVEGEGAPTTTCRELLLALRCHCAATALRSLDTALALPEPHRARELPYAVLAACTPLHLHGQHSGERANARRLLVLAGTGSAPQRRLAALSAAMHSCLFEARALPHEQRALAALQSDADATTRDLAAFAARSSLAVFDAWLASGKPHFDSQVLGRLEPEYLQRIPDAQLTRALEAVGAAMASSRPPPAGAGVTEQVLHAAQSSSATPSPGAYEARALLAAVVEKLPGRLQPSLARSEESRRRLASVLADRRSDMPPELHGWWLDQQHAAIDERFAGDWLPIAVAPALLGRLRRGERLEHTLPLLHTTRRYTDWHEAMDADADAFAAAAPHVPASLHAPFAELVTFGKRRRVAEQLLFAADTPAALRTLLVKHLRGGDERYPPSDAFVLACVESKDPEIAALAPSVARHATDSRERVAAVLLERLAALPAADERARRWMVGALHRFGHPAAGALLREQLRNGTPVLQCDAAIALASASEPDAEAMAWLRTGIASEDLEHRRQVWRWISFSAEVAPRFVEDAIDALAAGNDAQDALRLRALLATAAKTRRAEVIPLVERLTRHRDDEAANMAVHLLEELRQEPPR